MKRMKKAIALLVCLAVLASVFTVTTFAANSPDATIPEIVGTIISWRFRPFFWFVNFLIRLVTGMPLFPGLE